VIPLRIPLRPLHHRHPKLPALALCPARSSPLSVQFGGRQWRAGV
jgi:hypothetical protein